MKNKKKISPKKEKDKKKKAILKKEKTLPNLEPSIF